jgi:chaperonin cofactor prefoldin
MLEKLNEKLSMPEKLSKDENIDQVYQKYTMVKNDLDTELASWEKLNIELEELRKERGRLN